jgi:hypothetical protein
MRTAREPFPAPAPSLLRQDQLRPPVVPPAGGRLVRVVRVFLPEALDLQAFLRDAAADEEIRDDPGAIQGELQVEVVAPRRVRVAADVDVDVGEVGLQDVGLLVQDRQAVGLQLALAAVEGDLLRVVEDEDLRQSELPRDGRGVGAEAEDELDLVGGDDPDTLLGHGCSFAARHDRHQLVERRDLDGGRG